MMKCRAAHHAKKFELRDTRIQLCIPKCRRDSLQTCPNFDIFPERRFVAGFFRRLLAYLTPHISHTYPFNTYPTNTYPTNTYPFNTYPFNAYPFKRYARILSIRIVSIRIHAMRIRSMRIHSKGLHQQEWQCM